jgi:hypothetical protein
MSIQKAAEQYIRKRQFIQQALKCGIVNYSKLARLIRKETGINSVPAIQISCRRYAERLTGKPSLDIVSLLKATRRSIRDKIAVVILEPGTKFETLVQLQKNATDLNEAMQITRGANAVTLIVTEDLLSSVKKRLSDRILKVHTGLVEITLKSSVKLESVPGVMGVLYSLFAENDVNILETASCWTDTIVVIRKEDLAKTMGFLDF